MSETKKPADPQTVVDETREFWRGLAREAVKNSPTAIEETAKQLIGITGILEGLYFHAITFANLRGKGTGFWPLFVYLAPLIFWLFSLMAASLVFFPRVYDINVNAGEAAKRLHETAVSRKYLLLLLSLVLLIFGMLFLIVALGVYLSGA